jgi:hypothetical protein
MAAIIMAKVNNATPLFHQQQPTSIKNNTTPTPEASYSDW